MVVDRDDLPAWIEWLAQDENGVWWGFECEPNEGDCYWYENEVGRYLKLATGDKNPAWRASLQRR
ncbi:MAG: hypothetical protein Q9O24_06310 [Gammaproteobacteria bacterium]|nr:hypothetical protein [Gammaproteobacteria bacterium]